MSKTLIITALLATLTVPSGPLAAQSAEDSVKAPIKALFEGMRTGDSAMVRSAFAPGAVLQTIARTRDGRTFVRTESVDSFVAFVAKPHDAVYDERITYGSLLVDGPLASVWTPYRFYLGSTFSHCGVNSFQLLKVAGAWKIQYLIDTRRKENCAP